MQVLCMLWGVLAMLGAIVAFFPCLGALNWLMIPFSGIGLLLSVIAVATGQPGQKGAGIAGLVLCAIAVFVGIVRLAMGGGVL